MKKISLLLFLLLSVSVLAQYPILNDSVKKAGVYKTFAEFKNNNPSIPLNHSIISERKTFFGSWGKESINMYALQIPKDESRQIGDVFGFSDGKNFYMVASEGLLFPNDLHKFLFYKIKYLGKYPLMEVLHSNVSMNGTMVMSNQSVDLSVLYFETGELRKLTKGRLKEILADKPELLEKFKKQENKNDYLEEYLIKYMKI